MTVPSPVPSAVPRPGPSPVPPVSPPLRIVFVCLGNICRSPMAEAVLTSLVARAGLADLVRVSSAGTGDWHVGERADERAAAALAGRGYDVSRHRARQFARDFFAEHDLVLALDRGNERVLRRMAPTPADAAKVRLLRSFDPAGPRAEADALEVPDPYYGGPDGFTRALDLIEAACRGLVAEVVADLRGQQPAHTA